MYILHYNTYGKLPSANEHGFMVEKEVRDKKPER
jgi:hypothetical protein